MKAGVILLMVLMVLVLLVLLAGILTMAKGGEFNKKYGNKLMVLRVTCQGAAIAVFALLLMVRH